MAKKENQNQSTSNSSTNGFNKGLVKDYDENFTPDGVWLHARNLINNSVQGDLGIVGNEPANYQCGQAPYQVIGGIHIFTTFWAVFSTDNTNSEIGVYDEALCEYRTIVNDPCLNFKDIHLISGISKYNFDCSVSLYFADGNNPDRYMNIGNPDLWPTASSYTGNNAYNNDQYWPGVAWNTVCTTVNDCTTCENQGTLDCEKSRLSSLASTPCLTLVKGDTGGDLPNGSYIAVIAYSINGQKYGNYTSPSNVLPIFNHNNVAGAIELHLENVDTHYFTEFQLVIISTINGATDAKLVGTYSTHTQKIFLDYLNPALTAVPLDNIPIQAALFEKSDAMYPMTQYLIRVGPTTKYDFNYQPLANQIGTQWVVSQYPATYYRDGGYVVGYMRDEVYAFWIRWVYNTGEKSSSYHIPGRHSSNYAVDPTADDPVGSAPVETYFDNTDIAPVFETTNTATITGTGLNIPTEDGGNALATGYMGYWQSSERYPDNRADIWNATADTKLSGTTDAQYDLCGKNIRLHKIPEDIIANNILYSRATVPPDIAVQNVTVTNQAATRINIMGVQFDNIKPPVYYDDNGLIAVVPGIVGYEILRSSREGNRTIIAKGILNNMRKYNTPQNPVGGTNPEVQYFRGLYPNYPYNPLGDDPTLSTTPVQGSGVDGYNPVTASNVKKDYFTFHSPDTQFYQPFLAPKELRLYSELGKDKNVTGNFEPVPGHPKEKLLTDIALISAAIVGIAEAGLAMQGKMGKTIDGSRTLALGLAPEPAFSGVPAAPSTVSLPPTGSAAITAGIYGANNTFFSTANSLDLLTSIVTGGSIPFVSTDAQINETAAAAEIDPAIPYRSYIGHGINYTFDKGAADYMPAGLRTISGVLTYGNYWNTATGANIDLIYAVVPYRQYAYRYVSHGYLHKDNIGAISQFANKRYAINEAAYIDNSYRFFREYHINNLYRSKAVILNTGSDVNNPSILDNTVTSIGEKGLLNNPSDSFQTTASCYYTGLKIRVRNLYGQLDAVKQIPVKCPIILDKNNPIPASAITSTQPGTNIPLAVTQFNSIYTSPILFGGDTYIGRYTEKNTFFYFYDWLYKEPDGTAMDYREKYLGLYPRFWADFTKYDVSGFISSIVTSLFNPGDWNTPANTNNLDDETLAGISTGIGNMFDAIGLPGIGDAFEQNGFFGNIASRISTSLRFGKKNAYFYLFQSAVRDFFVESEINIDLRDWGQLPEERHYDPYAPYTSLQDLFYTDIIKFGNYYKYDKSLSASRLWSNVISWGNMQDREYNPTVSSLCYQYQPFRLIYSLPDSLESKQDNWRIFLPNNFKDFKSQISCIKPTGKNGALILFQNDGPIQFQGVDTLETDLGTKVTIGDGGLFSQPQQSLVNSDESYEYGSCQDRLSVINTPAGSFWISQSLGKLFSVTEGFDEISAYGLKWWFAKFLPFRLLVDFPDFQLIDNPVAGIGCQSMYDNQDQILYFCKKDYRLRTDLPEGINITYSGNANQFLLNGKDPVSLKDSTYFEDVSWTVSFDPKTKAFISFHDWKPDLMFPSKANFLSVKGNGVWRHNDRTDLFCNYYGQSYPFEIEYVMDTGQQVNTTRSLEYLLECYVYDDEGIDKFHLLDFNFDELVVFNTEQVSGKLILNDVPKNNPFARLNYPQVNATDINILYDKVEQKYRINQFWDVTADRGEFNLAAQRPIWDTSWNGYIKNLNPANLDYAKSVFQRKRFRHYLCNVFFRRNESGNVKMMLKIANNKNLNSPR